MEKMQIFNNDTFGEIRTILRDGEPWFVAADVCRALDVSNHKDAISRLDADEKSGVVLTDPHGREQKTNCVNEPGLYALVLGSRKPAARAFRRWITHEVIPAIRRHGAYATPETLDRLLGDPDFAIRTFTALKQERDRRIRLEGQVEQDAPKVLFAESVAASRQAILVGELAKILKQNGVDIGQNRLFKRLRDEGYLCSRGDAYNQPTQRAMLLSLFEITKNVVTNPNGTIRITSTTKVTGKGQIYFINKYMTGFLAG